MAEQQKITIEDFQALVTRSGMNLNAEELQHLKPMYEHFLGPVSRMHELDLDAEDLAVVFQLNSEKGIG